MVRYLDADGEATTADEAVSLEFIEYDDAGQVIAKTSADLGDVSDAG